MYASSPVAHAAHQMRISCEPAACARSSIARHGIVSSCWRSRKKKVSLIVTSSIERRDRAGALDRVGDKREEGGCIAVRQRTHDGRAQRRMLSRLDADAALAKDAARRPGRARRSSQRRPFERDRGQGFGDLFRSAGSSPHRASLLRMACRRRPRSSSSWAIVSPPASRIAAEPVGAVAAHPGQHDRDAGALCALRDAPEQHVARRSVQRSRSRGDRA